MKLLLIDTCGASGSIALANNTEILATASLPGRTASERLVATIKELAAANLPLQSLEAIAIVHGPGSFTGVRTGLSAAKGLGEALSIPLVAISRLAVLARLAETPKSYPLLDAGRGEFYFGEYSAGICHREALLTRDQVLAAVESDAHLVTCDAEVIDSLPDLQPRLVAEPTAADALPLALARIEEESFDDPVILDANYLRRTDAEIFAKPARSARRPLQPKSDISVRPAVLADLASILALERVTPTAPHWPASTYAAMLDAPAEGDRQRCLLVAESGRSLTGFAVGVLSPSIGDANVLHAGPAHRGAELESVAVAESFRRAGIGRALCQAVLEWSRRHGATEVILEVRASSAAPIALYSSLGFRETGRRPKYYHQPEDDALLMQLELRP